MSRSITSRPTFRTVLASLALFAPLALGGSVGASTAAAAAAGTVTEFGGSPGSAPKGIVAGPDGNLWFGGTNGRIGQITPTGVVAQFTAGMEPYGVAAGPDGNLWVANSGSRAGDPGGGSIARITPSGAATQFTLGITPGAYPYGITAGPDGNLWFTEYYGDKGGFTSGKVGRITPAGAVTEFPIADLNAGARPQMITGGPDGNVWFTEQIGRQIGRITPAGALTYFALSGLASDITTGPDGNLWFTEYPDRIGRITPAGAITEFTAGITGGSNPSGIAAGPDGNLWFTETSGDRVGRITPAGVVTEFSVGISSNAQPRAITAGPDGNMWFTEPGRGRIGRIATGGADPGSGPTPGPTGLTLGVGGPSRQIAKTSRSIYALIRCSVACTAYSSAKVTVGTRTIAAWRGPRSLEAGARTRVRFLLSRRHFASLRSALRRGRRARFVLTVQATNDDGATARVSKAWVIKLR